MGRGAWGAFSAEPRYKIEKMEKKNACWPRIGWNFSSIFYDFLKEKGSKTEKVHITKDLELNKYYGFYSAGNGNHWRFIRMRIADSYIQSHWILVMQNNCMLEIGKG